MLNDFFKLNGQFAKFTCESDVAKHFQTSSHLANVLYEPDNWPSSPFKLKKQRYTNVSLSKTLFRKVTFKECHFEDCLFIGSRFEDVEFHRCIFKNCNFFKSEFSGCYIDPKTIQFDHSYKKTHANVGVALYQQLLDNSADQHQADHAMAADMSFRQWQRSQLKRDLKVGKINEFQYISYFIKNFVFEIIAGYGYSPLRFFIWTIVLFFLISFLNFHFLSDSLIISGAPAAGASLIDSVYYTFSVLTVLGFSTVTPVSPTAKLVTVLEALAAVGWLGIFTAVLVKRFIK